MRQSTNQKNKGPLNRTFSSEALLQQAIAGLLIRMPDTTSVQILQGTQELGKDLIFYIRGAFGEQVLCACVVKNTKITGDAGKSEGARTVFLQAQQAFDTPHTDERGRDIYIERVYVVTPFDLPPATIGSIKGQLRERAGQVIFIGGSTLFDLFKEYWPDFLADEADVLEQHLKETSRRYEEDNPLSSLVSQYHLGSIDPNYKKIYVTQTFHREFYAYSKGRLLTNSIPTEQILSRPWTLKDVRKTVNELRRLRQGLSFLKDWGYLDEKVLTGSRGLDKSLVKFSSALENSWRVGLEKRRKVFRDVITKIGEEEMEIDLHKLEALINQANAISKTMDKMLSGFTLIVNLLNNVVESSASLKESGLSYKIFHAICTLSECIKSAPGGIFEVVYDPENQTTHYSRVFRLPKDIHDWWNGYFMIVGAPGYGKTSFCRWHALQDVERYTSGHSTVLPVYIPLHRLAKGSLKSFKETFLGTLGKSALLVEGQQEDTNTQFRLYLDGLDEVPSQSRREEIINLAREGLGRTNKYQIILTAREHVRGHWLNWIPRISLSGFDEAEVITLVSKWLGKASTEAEKFYDQLRGVPALANLMQTPLLATLIILVFRQTGRLPESKTKLYEMFVDLLSGGWDMAKGILRESKFGPRIKIMTVTTLAGDMHEQGRREFGDVEIKQAIQSIFSRKGLEDWETLRNELVEDALISKSGNVYQFSHLSFQEFLTAKSFISDPQPKRTRRALESLLYGNNWWREVIRFYIGLSTKPREITLWLLSEIDRIANKTTKPLLRERVNDLILGVIEAFPEFPVGEVIDYTPSKSAFQLNLKAARPEQ